MAHLFAYGPWMHRDKFPKYRGELVVVEDFGRVINAVDCSVATLGDLFDSEGSLRKFDVGIATLQPCHDGRVNGIIYSGVPPCDWLKFNAQEAALNFARVRIPHTKIRYFDRPDNFPPLHPVYTYFAKSSKGGFSTISPDVVPTDEYLKSLLEAAESRGPRFREFLSHRTFMASGESLLSWYPRNRQ